MLAKNDTCYEDQGDSGGARYEGQEDSGGSFSCLTASLFSSCFVWQLSCLAVPEGSTLFYEHKGLLVFRSLFSLDRF